MSFFPTTTFARPKSRKQTRPVSSKWTDLQPRERKAPGLKQVGKKGLFWQFVAQIINEFLLRIELPKTCEVVSEFCDNYHLTPAHSRRRSVIPITDWFHALRICVACTECHAWADHREREESEAIIEPIITDRFKRMGLSEEKVRQLLLECAAKVQEENPRFQEFYVQL